VDREFRSIATLLGGISAVMLIVLGLVGWRISTSVTAQLGGEPRQATAVMQQAAAGDLTAPLGDAREGSMLKALSSMVGALRSMMGEINSGANQLVSNADHITRVSAEVADAAVRQSDATAAHGGGDGRADRQLQPYFLQRPGDRTELPRKPCALPRKAANGSVRPPRRSARCRKR
jgi:methyl-accepting chemotaxis protein